jgi:hypothetical protein
MMQHGRYLAAIEYDPEEESFYGRTVNVSPGGFDFWGSSVEELRREFAASADVFEEVTREKGISAEVAEPPSPASVAASALGRRRSPAKTASSRANGLKGGRPRAEPSPEAARLIRGISLEFLLAPPAANIEAEFGGEAIAECMERGWVRRPTRVHGNRETGPVYRLTANGRRLRARLDAEAEIGANQASARAH